MSPRRKTLRLMAVSFLSVVLLVIVMGLAAINEVKSLADLSRAMYQHPFAVSNALLDANVDILEMRQHLLEVVVAPSREEFEESVSQINEHEANVYKHFETIRENFLGDPAKFVALRKIFADWKPIRSEVIELVRAGGHEEIRPMVMEGDNAGSHFDLILQEIEGLVDFARTKADEFALRGQDVRNKSLAILILMIVAISLLTMIIFVFTTRKLNEEAGQIHKLSNAVEQSPSVITITDTEGIIEYVNPAFTAVTGYEAAEVIGKNPNILKSGETPPEVYEELWQTIKSGKVWSGISMNRRKNGKLYWDEMTISPVHDDRGVIINYVGIAQDITGRREAEEQIRKLSNAVEQSPSVITIADAEGILEYVNPAFTAVTGYEAEEVIGKNPNILQSGKTPLEVYEELWRTVKSGKTWSGVAMNRRKNGDIYWNELTISPVHDDHGAIINYVGVGQDISDRREAESQLRKLSNAVKHSASWIIITDPEGVIEYVNPAFTLLTGYEAEEAIGKNPSLWQSGETPLEVYEDLWRTIKSGKIWTGDLKGKGKNGEFFWTTLTVAPIRDTKRDIIHFVGTGTDVTAQRETERQLIHARKMDTVGQLTGGIAHDFNNILGIVRGNLELLERLAADDPEMSDRVQKATKSAERGTSLVKKLLGFSRKGTVQTRLTNVNELIKSQNELIAKSLTPSIEVEQHLAADLWSVEINPDEFEDALLNLALNAGDAMPEGGALFIETANKILDETHLKRSPQAKAGEFVMISVNDTGTGMTPEIQERIFEPFFTTKEQGRGTGLGLSTMYGFVQRSGGHVKVYSEVGEGTIIHIYLPRAHEGTARHEETIDIEESASGGSETILIVDDEAGLVDIAVTFLESLGYRTLSASNGNEALKILEDNKDIDLMFTDVIMPGGPDGYKLAQSARKIRPSLKVLVTSGFSRRHEKLRKGEGTAAAALATSLIDKPYTLTELARAVRHTLDKEEADET